MDLGVDPVLFSAALCRGLIEAPGNARTGTPVQAGFPRLYAAASLKLLLLIQGVAGIELFSAALCRGLIEAPATRQDAAPGPPFSAALCRGLIEA